MLGVYGVNCPSKPMVYKWIERFADGYDTVEELKRTGRPSSPPLISGKKVPHKNSLLPALRGCQNVGRNA